MDEHEVSIQARFDQINAGHRDALAAVKRAKDGLELMTDEERREFIDSLDPTVVEIFNALSAELEENT